MASSNAGLIPVFLIACLLWLPNIGVLPAWDWDEGYNLNYAKNLGEGRLLWFSLKYAFVPHPPVYLSVLALFVKVFGNSILVIRLLSVALNFMVIYLLYLIGGRIGGPRMAFFTSLLYAIYPSAVYWGRMGFSNHLLNLLVVSSMYFLLRFNAEGGRWWVPACLLAGLSPVTEPQGFLVAAALTAYFIATKRNTLSACAFLIGPTLVFAAVMAASSNYFIDDILHQTGRLKITVPVIASASALAALLAVKRKQALEFMNRMFEKETTAIFGSKDLFRLHYVPIAMLLAHLLSSTTLIAPISEKNMFVGGDYYWLGILGLLLLPAAYMNRVVLVYFLPSFTAVIAFGRADHMLIPLYPFFALGVACLLPELYVYLKPRIGVAAAIIILSYPFPAAVFNDLSAYVIGNQLAPEPVDDLRSVVAYVRNHSSPGDYIITTTHIARYFDNATTITQAVVYEGYPVEYYYGEYPKDRYVFNVSFRNAKYAVVPPGTVEWFKTYAPNASSEMGGWPIVNKSGRYLVLSNPTSK